MANHYFKFLLDFVLKHLSSKNIIRLKQVFNDYFFYNQNMCGTRGTFQTRGRYSTFTVTALIYLFNEIFHIPTEIIFF